MNNPQFDWILETLDGEDVVDVDHADRLMDFGAERLREAAAHPDRFSIGLKRTLQRGRFTHLSYAYIQDGELEPIMRGDLSAHTPRSKRAEAQQFLKTQGAI